MRFFCMVSTSRQNVPLHQMKFHVEGDECALVGTWHEGKPYRPNKAQFRAALPARWRAAFDREQAFWHDKDGPQCTISLSDRRGNYVATVYCNACPDAPPADNDAFGRRDHSEIFNHKRAES